MTAARKLDPALVPIEERARVYADLRATPGGCIADELVDSADKVAKGIEKRIAKTRATTAAGLIAQVRLLVDEDGVCDRFKEPFTETVVAGIKELVRS